MAINLHACSVFSRKYISSSDESIENLLYYRDCNHKAKETTSAPMPLRMAAPMTQPPQNDCPFPKMCCSMSCGNECGQQQHQSVLERQMEPMRNMQQSIQPIQSPPRQPNLPVQPPLLSRGRKKKMKPGAKMPFPMGGRRDFGFTKEKIKSLISQDEDIRKILKDLVRVTMQKVDLLEMMNARRNNDQKISESSEIISVEDDL